MECYRDFHIFMIMQEILESMITKKWSKAQPVSCPGARLEIIDWNLS